MLSTPLLALALVAQAPQADAAPASQAKLIPELREAFTAAPAAETFHVYAALSERMTYADFAGRVERFPRGERQQFVEDELRAFADARQAGVLALLDELEQQGLVTDVRQLWITNTVRFHGTQAAVEAVAALPEVAYVGWEPERDPTEYQDAGPAQPAPAPQGAFTTYYFEGFESGGLPAGSSTSVTGCGDVQVTGSYGPKTGGFHLVMASSSDLCDGTATFQLQVDLSAATTATLRFGFQDMNDEFTPGLDVLEASDDGVSWTPILDLTGSDGAYIFKEVALDPFGLTYDTDVFLRWRWTDNYTPTTDGFGIDDIEIADGFDPPPPPSPQPNLVQHQAPALWALGYDGSGALLLNVDDGVDLDHPDLVNRIWTNPNDPVDGIDNDGNGYVDDVNGWDMVGDDNNPDGGGHGTNTAGIMVGDGSSGLFLTGMAPGASLVAARISGEGDHWEALQYGLSIGVDASCSSFSYKWYFSPKPDYHMHRSVSEMLLAAGIIHANSIGNDGGSGSAPIPFNISAPGLCPGPWLHPQQAQLFPGLGATLGCGGIELNDSHYGFSGSGPSAWEDLTTYDASFPHAQDPAKWDYPVGGFGGASQGLMKPDVVTYTNVATTSYGGGHSSSFGGTSAATPHLGGTYCLLIGAQPNAEPRHVSQAIQRSAEDLGVPGKDPVFGAGKVQVLDAAMRLFHLVKADTPLAPLGGTVNLDMYGAPGGSYATFWSPNLGSLPTGFGTLDLGLPLFVAQSGVLDAGGHDSLAVNVPSTPGLVGADIFVQSIEDGTAGPFATYLISVVDTFRITL